MFSNKAALTAGSVPALFRSGYVTLIGRPNVGKSTILNFFLGQKISIVTAKPQTTRNRIIGIRNDKEAQIVFIDTPGIHKPFHLLGETMVRTAKQTLQEIDLVVFVADAGKPHETDKAISETLRTIRKPVLLAINKIDTVKKTELLAITEQYRELLEFSEIIPVSARKHDGMDLLLQKISGHLPHGPRYYPEDIFTDQLERFMVAEIIREKIILKTAEEVPHSVAVEVVQWSEKERGLVSISANIYVERESQKGIIIGKAGRMLKQVGSLARADIERLLGTKVFLELWVKVKKGWRDNKNFLDELGYL